MSDVPDADAQEQATPVGDEPDDEAPAVRRPDEGIDVPEADALEQTQVIQDDDDDWR